MNNKQAWTKTTDIAVREFMKDDTRWRRLANVDEARNKLMN